MNGTNGADVLNGTSGDDKYFGLAGDDTLYGGGGNDFLDGGLGDDRMAGGAGNDLFIVDSLGDVVVEVADEGMDEVRTSLAAYALTAHVETLRGLTDAGQSLTGNDLANRIIGLGGADRLFGAGGDDSLAGGDGDDRLYGGAGNDQMNGGNGIDLVSYTDATTGIVVSLAITRAQNTGGAGNDTLTAVENLEGSAYADVLTGSAAANRLDGGTGADQLFGGMGDDVLVGSDRSASGFDLLDGGAGRDTAAYAGARANYTVTRVGDEVRVSAAGANGYDVLRNMEAIAFADGSVDLATSNTPPVAYADFAVLGDAQRSVGGNVLANDVDADGDRLSLVAPGTFGLAYGTLSAAADGAWTYTVADGALTRGRPLEDQLTYQVSDGRGGLAGAVLRVTLPQNAWPPALANDRAATDEDTPVLVDVLANDAGSGLALVSASVTGGGTVGIRDGKLLFDPRTAFDALAAGASGSATITYTAVDSNGVSADASVAVTIAGINDAPVVQALPAGWSITAGRSFSLTLPVNAMIDDDGGQAIRYALGAGASGLPQWASWDAPARTLSGTAPVGTAAGTLGLTLTGTEPDGAATSVALSVAVNAAPTAAPMLVSTANGLIFIQRDGTTGALAYTGDAARVTKSGQIVLDWTAGGTIAGIPQGDGYTLEVRTGTKVTTAPLAVGIVVEALGQSNMSTWFTDASAAYDRADSVYRMYDGGTAKPSTWVAATGAGVIGFASTLRATLGDVPVAVIDGSAGGTRLTSAAGLRTWSDTGAGSLYQNALDKLIRMTNGRAEFVIWNQGETDAGARATADQYASALKALMARTVGDMGNPFFIIAGLSTLATGSDAVRAGQAIAVQGNSHAVYVPTQTDLETIGGTHLTSVGHAWQGFDVAQAALDHLLPNYQHSVPVNGAAGADSLTGTAAADRLQGGAGDDVLWGADQNDFLRGQIGNDTLYGGLGNDALSGGGGADVLDGGEGSDDLFGDDGDDRLFGGAAGDYLDGNLGADAMSGGAGDDRYIVDHAGDTVIEDDGAGNDTGGRDGVYASVTFTLPRFVEELWLTGSVPTNGTGNALANMINGSQAANILWGLDGADTMLGQAGDDTLYGGSGNDTMNGGPGADAMFGGAGDDLYTVDNLGDTVDERTAGADAGGNDQVQASVSFVLPSFVESLVILGSAAADGTGNAQANLIKGNAAINVLDGAGGDDTLVGNAGDDTLRGGTGTDLLQGGDGRDVLVGGAGIDRMTGDTSARYADTFVFLSGDGGVGAGTRDVITDFDTLDRIDLSAFDADPDAAGQQHLTYIGTAAFSAAGQLHLTLFKGYAVLAADLNGDGAADLEIELTGVARTIDPAQLLL